MQAATQATETAAPADTAVSEEQADKDFESGYSVETGVAPPQESKPDAKQAQPTKTEEGDAKAPAAAATKGEATEKKTAAPAPTLHFGKYTEQQIHAVFDKVAEVDAVRTELAAARDQIQKLTGSVGIAHQALQALKNGQPTKVTKDLLKKLNENGYGELAELLAEDLSGIVKTSVVPGTSDFDATAFQKAVDDKVGAQIQEIRHSTERKLLSVAHPDWAAIYESNDFKAWKALHPADVQQALETSWDSEWLGKGLAAFKKWREEQAATKKAADTTAAAQRTKRLEAGVQPTKGQSISTGHAQPSDDELFELGYKEEASARGG